MAKDIILVNPIKIITSGNAPSADNLGNGQMGAGKVGKRKAMYVNMNGTVDDMLAYDTTEADEATTVKDFGGIKKGTTAKELKGKPVSEILDTLIFPVVEPDFTPPSASISFKSTASTPVLQEVGTSGGSVPGNADFNYIFNRGAISIAGTKVQDRAGAEVSHKFQCSVNGGDVGIELPTAFAERGTYDYQVAVSYAAGPQPKDNKGNDYGTPLPAGRVTSGKIRINVEYPYFANTEKSTALEKLALTTNNYIEPQCVSESATGRHQFALPASFTIESIEYFDTVANRYNPMDTGEFDVTEYQQDVQGNQVGYKKYVRNTVGLSGATKFKITFTKA